MSEAMFQIKFRECEQERKALVAIRKKLESENESLRAQLLRQQEGVDKAEVDEQPVPEAQEETVADAKSRDSLSELIDGACKRYAENHQVPDYDLFASTVQVAARWLKKWREGYINPGLDSISVETNGFVTQAATKLAIPPNDLKNLVFAVLS
jgi:hypothetical protein